MISDVLNLKKKYRHDLLQRRKQLSVLQRQIYSQQIMQHLLQHLALSFSPNETVQILIYRAKTFEVDTSALFSQQQYQIFVPRMKAEVQMEWVAVDDTTIWQEADFAVLEPLQGALWQKKIGVKTVLVSPVLGFDAAGYRLGMGKGYFDRWLAQYALALDMQLGLAFSCQELSKVPVEPHDVAFATMITERGVQHV